MNNQPIEDQIDLLFRQHSGQLTSTLTRIFGIKYIDEVESVVQETFLKACQAWPYNGLPQNPIAWLTTVAKNQCYDLIHQNRKLDCSISEIDELGDEPVNTSLSHSKWVDDVLGMMYVCCEPSLSRKAQICLTLKVVSGFSVKEIAAAFFSKEQAIKRLISRSKESIRSVYKRVKFPQPSDLKDRIDNIVEVLYLMFNEGYSSASGNLPIRQDLCDEAIRLSEFLLHESFNLEKQVPKIKALIALMLLHSAKNPARIDQHGLPILLQDQDRNLWNKQRISLGLKFLGESSQGEVVSRYHLEAHIVSCHVMASSYDETNWSQVMKYYDLLLKVDSNPLIRMNRAIALSKTAGPEIALVELLPLRENVVLKEYYLLYASLGDVYGDMGDHHSASEYFGKALSLTNASFKKEHLRSRLNNFIN